MIAVPCSPGDTPLAYQPTRLVSSAVGGWSLPAASTASSVNGASTPIFGMSSRVGSDRGRCLPWGLAEGSERSEGLPWPPNRLSARTRIPTHHTNIGTPGRAPWSGVTDRGSTGEDNRDAIGHHLTGTRTGQLTGLRRRSRRGTGATSRAATLCAGGGPGCYVVRHGSGKAVRGTLAAHHVGTRTGESQDRQPTGRPARSGERTATRVHAAAGLVAPRVRVV